MSQYRIIASIEEIRKQPLYCDRQYSWFKWRADWDRSKRLTAWSRVLVEKLTVPQLVKHSHVMETDVSLPHSKQRATCPSSEADQPNPHSISWWYFLILTPSKPSPSKKAISFWFLLQTPLWIYPVPLRATCPAHLLFFHLVTSIILYETYTP